MHISTLVSVWKASILDYHHWFPAQVAVLLLPAATAYLLTDRLPVMIGLAVACGALAATLGYGVAVATLAGALFGLAFLFAPEQGLIARTNRQARQRRRFAVETLIVHLVNHEGTQIQAAESAVAHHGEELRWADRVRDEAIARAAGDGLIARENGHLALTATGRETARGMIVR